ncbi:beta strand repeat-containing protein [Leptothoe kymatousa]|uniref:DUF11 domain-containing protein n=1 Tax=Leptothoe kymatousa TAU-MAC 1615 TaxID=2364775 RepID=A0ABS5Y3W0_9CYAN|nr:hypothetical protein [Leptothoe kymatousa]MBT9312507.1 hypothetical protein [Leptothoe kymatousa TAU-MAC 1615]
MKRLLKKIIKKQFGATASPKLATPKNVFAASALTAATLSLVTGRSAQAFSIFPVDLSTYGDGVTNEELTVTDQFGNEAFVNFDWTFPAGTLNALRPATFLTGGFEGGSSLEVIYDPRTIAEEVNLDITFANGVTGAPAAVERARLIVLDIDRDNSNTWQDLIELGGSVAPNVTLATQASNPLGVSPEIAAQINGIPLGIDQPNGGNAPGLAILSDYTVFVDNLANQFIGVYNPRSLDARLQNSTDPLTTEFDPKPTGTAAVNPANSLPEGGLNAPPATGVEANNASPEGTITADYIGSGGAPVNNLSLVYGNGPASPSLAVNGPGTAGFVNNPNDNNGGPLSHGIGLYTVFIVPGVIGTAKNASAPVQVGNTTAYNVTYTVNVENLGASTPLTDVQATDNLVNTFQGATDFTVSNVTLVSGNLTPNPNFNGNTDQNLFVAGGTLAPGASAVMQYTVTLDTASPDINSNVQYDNTVIAAGTTPIGLRITDTSDDDSTIGPNDPPDPDPNNNGDPGDPGEDTPTPVTLPVPPVNLNPNINVAEEVFNIDVDPTTGPAPTFPDNTARVSYRVRVQNTGDERLTNVTLTNDFTPTFDSDNRGGSGPDTGFEIVSVTRTAGTETEGAIEPNAAYNGGDSVDSGGVGGAADNPTLAQGGILNPGEFTEYEILVDVDTTGNGETLVRELPGPFDNFTTATGVGTDLTTPSGTTVTDISNDIGSFGTLEAALNPDGDPANGGSSVDGAPPVAGDPENIPTPVSIPLTTDPRINISERVISNVFEPTGTYGVNTGRVTYRIRVQNTGDEDLQNVLVTNDFTDTFDNSDRGGSGLDTGFEIVSSSFVNGVNLPVNPTYDGGDTVENGAGPNGANDDNLIDPTSATRDLAVGEFSEYDVVVDVDLTDNGETLISALPGPYDNFSRTEGVGVISGDTVRDVSNDATDFNNDLEAALNPAGGDPDGGGTTDPETPPEPSTTPADENVPTPVQLSPVPLINVSEEVVGTPELNPAGGAFGANTGRVIYRIRVQNTGSDDLNNVTLVNDFTETFDNGLRGGSGADNGFEIVSVTELTGTGQTPNAPNATYDGGDSDATNDVGPGLADDNQLLTNGSLAVGEFSEYEIVVDVDLTDDGETLTTATPGPFDNSTTARGTGITSGIGVVDVSNDRTLANAPTLEDALNPDGGSTTGGAEIGTPANNPPTAPAVGTPENIATPVNFPLQRPLINVAEQVFDTTLNPTDGPTATFPGNTARLSYRIRVQNTGDERLTNVTLTNDFTPTFDSDDRGGSGPDTGFEIVSVTRSDGNETEGAIEPNANYNGGDSVDSGGAGGAADDATLAQGGILNPGEFTEYEILVDVDTTGNGETLVRALPGPFDNFTTATGVGTDLTTPSGLTVTDISNDIGSFGSLEEALNPPGGSPDGGVTPDPNLPANDPANENVPTQADIILTPEISVIERIDDSRTEVGGDIPGATFGDSNVRLVYQVVVRNIGVEDLQNVELTNSFTDTFGVLGSGATDDYTIVGPPTFVSGATTVPVNPAFDGSGDLRLAGDPADPASVLNTGEFAVYEILVDVNTAGSTVAPNLPGPYDNQTIATGIGVGSQETTTDLSNDINPFPAGGTTPDPTTSDPNGNSEANEADENVPTPALLGSDLRLVKRITQVIRNGQSVNIAGINEFTDQPGAEDDNELATSTRENLPLGVFEVLDTLQSGDEVEYTVYFFNRGSVQAANVEMCDELQVVSGIGTILQPASLELASPVPFASSNTLDFDGTSTLLFPQAPLAPLAASCTSFPGSFPSGNPAGGLGVGVGGGVVVGGPDLGLDVDAGSVGAFRFRVNVQ